MVTTNNAETDVETSTEESPLAAAEKAAAEESQQPSPDASSETGTNTGSDSGEEGEGPPPLPPVLELASSNIATAGGVAYGAAGPAGLVAVGAVAAAGGAAYLATSARRRREAAAAAGGDSGKKGGRFRSLVGRGAGTRGALAGGRGRGGGLRGLSGRARSGTGGPGSARSRLGAGGLGSRGGAPGAGGRGTGSLSRLWGRSSGPGAGGRSGGGGLFGSSGGRWGAGGGSGARGLAGASKGTGLLGKSSRLGGGTGGGGTGALGRAAGRAGTRGGRRGGRGGLFGAGRRRPAGRVTAISDPAIPSPSGRPLRGAFGAVRRGWNHPRMKGGRARFKKTSERTRDYMRKRARRLRTKAFFQNLRGWWERMRARVRGEERYGPMWWASEAASAMAVAALGPSRRRSSARPPLTGRIIGTSARTPGELTAGTGARLLAITTGDGEYTVTNKPGEITRAESAAEEMRAALAAFGSSDVHMLTYEQGLRALPEVLRAVGTGLQQMSSASEGEQPLNPAVTDYMHQLSGAMESVAAVADELHPLFREAHESELELLERRRPNAHRWDSSRRDS